MSTLSDLLSRKSLWRPQNLGPLESQVLRILASNGESSVRDVLNQLDRPLAYTTVMTTLDRLFKKGLLDRHMADRSFRYVPSDQRLRRAQNTSDAPGLFHSQSARELLVSQLLDTVCEYDETLLDELERKIAERRTQYDSQSAEEGKTTL
jgi:predicted transcriptional regulator